MRVKQFIQHTYETYHNYQDLSSDVAHDLSRYFKFRD
jgi:hypothetical protein